MNHLASRLFRNACLSRAVVMLCLCAFAVHARADSVADLFSAANKLYEQQKYTAAAAEYEKVIQGGYISPNVYFNLGNAYFKAGQSGRAIAAYRHAEQMAPRDPDIQANLQLARNEAGIKDAASNWLQWLRRLTLNEWTVIAAVVLWLFFLLLTLGQWRPSLRKPLRLWTGVVAVAGIFLVICVVSAAQDAIGTTYGIVVTQEAVVRRGPLDESQSYFTVRDGAEVQVLDRKDKWLQVTDRSRRIGWLQEAHVVVLNGSR